MYVSILIVQKQDLQDINVIILIQYKTLFQLIFYNKWNFNKHTSKCFSGQDSWGDYITV